MDASPNLKVKAHARPVGRPRQGLDTRLIANFDRGKVKVLRLWLTTHPEHSVSSLLREALDDVMHKHGIL